MIIKFTKDLKKQNIYANGSELASMMGMDRDKKGNKVYSYPETKTKFVATINNPVLITDTYQMFQFDPITRDTLQALFSSDKRTIEYDKTSMLFRQSKYPGLWGPNIDTMFFCKAIQNADFSETKNLGEIGAGSGFITKYILNNNSQIETALMMDINPYSGKCINEHIKDERANFQEGDAILTMKNKKFDTLICNPPYIIRPKSVEDNAYEGLGLFEEVVKTLNETLNENGKFYSVISSISEKQALKACEQANCSVKYLDSMNVPLKVLNIYNNKDWLNHLLNNSGLREENKNGHPYWHTINLAEIKPNKQALKEKYDREVKSYFNYLEQTKQF